MDDDLLQWASPAGHDAEAFPGVGVARGADLVKMAEIRPPTIGKPRSRPNRGRKRRYIGPFLDAPPADVIRDVEQAGYPVPRDLTPLPEVPACWRRGDLYVAWRAATFAMWGYRCHLCDHPNAHTVDHLIPLSKWGNQPYDPRLSRPAHGIEGCDECGLKCNSSRGHRALAREIGHYKPPIVL